MIKTFKCRDDNIKTIILSRDDSFDVLKYLNQAYKEFIDSKQNCRKIDDHFIVKLPDSELFKNNVIIYEPIFGDFEWEFDSNFKDEKDAIKFFKKIQKKFNDDFHLTLETLKEKNKYNGVRE